VNVILSAAKDLLLIFEKQILRAARSE